MLLAEWKSTKRFPTTKNRRSPPIIPNPTESAVTTRAEGTIKAEGARAQVEVEVEVEVEVARIAPNAARKMTVRVHEAEAEAEGVVSTEGLPNDGLEPIKSMNKKNEAYVPG